MKNRLTGEGLITTILGIVILIFSGLSIWFNKMEADDAAGWITTGLIFLRSKDSLLNLENRFEKIRKK